MVTRNSRGDILFVLCLAMLLMFLAAVVSLIDKRPVTPQTTSPSAEEISDYVQPFQGLPSFTRRYTC